MQVQNVPIDSITPYERNPRRNAGAVDAVAESIKQFGWNQPIVVDKNNVIIVGHTRLKAAKKLGLKEVPVLVAENLNDEQVKKYRILDNKTNELSEWDFQLLKSEIADFNLDFEGFNLDFDTTYSPAFAQQAEGGAEDEGGEFNDEDLLPEELQGQNLTPDELQKFEGQEGLAYDRVILVFKSEQTDKVLSFLGLKSLDKTVYPVDEIPNF